MRAQVACDQVDEGLPFRLDGPVCKPVPYEGTIMALELPTRCM
jgi:hypothetical protein